MFTETITTDDGTTGPVRISESHALNLLRRGARLHRSTTIEATPQGGAVVRRLTLALGSLTPRSRVITLAPLNPVTPLSVTARADLAELIGRTDHHPYLVDKTEYEFRHRQGRVFAGFFVLPPGTVTRYRQRDLIAARVRYDSTSNRFLPESRYHVEVTLPARLALVAQAHRARATRPTGWHHPAAVPGMEGTAGLNRPGRHAGLTHDSSSRVHCTCGELRGTYGTVGEARAAARRHLEEKTAALIGELDRDAKARGF